MESPTDSARRPAKTAPPTRKELWVILVLLFDLALVATLRANAMDRRQSRNALADDEISSTELDAPARLLYQALAGAAADIADERLALRDRWPTVPDLADTFVPPFATEALPADLRQTRAERAASAPAWADYLLRYRTAEEDSHGALVLRMIDRKVAPDPFDHPHPHLPRREANSLDDGGRWGLQIWFHGERDAAHGGTDLAEGGWRWVVPENGAAESADRTVRTAP